MDGLEEKKKSAVQQRVALSACQPALSQHQLYAYLLTLDELVVCARTKPNKTQAVGSVPSSHHDMAAAAQKLCPTGLGRSPAVTRPGSDVHPVCCGWAKPVGIMQGADCRCLNKAGCTYLGVGCPSQSLPSVRCQQRGCTAPGPSFSAGRVGGFVGLLVGLLVG